MLFHDPYSKDARQDEIVQHASMIKELEAYASELEARVEELETQLGEMNVGDKQHKSSSMHHKLRGVRDLLRLN